MSGSALALVGACSMGGCAAAPPGSGAAPSGATTSEVKVTLVPIATSSAAIDAPRTLQIASRFEIDPAEPLPPGAVARCGTTRMRSWLPSALAVLDTGSVLAIDYAPGGMALRDVAAPKEIAPLPLQRLSAFSPDASILALVPMDTQDHVWLLATKDGARLADVPIAVPQDPAQDRFDPTAFGNSIEKLLFSPDGAALLVTTRAGGVTLVEVPSGKVARSAKLPAGSRATSLGPRGDRMLVEHVAADKRSSSGGFVGGTIGGTFDLASIGSAREKIDTVTLVSARTGKTVRKLDLPDLVSGAPATSAGPRHRLSADGAFVYRLEDGAISAILAETSSLRTVAKSSRLSSSADFTVLPDGKHALVGATLWDLSAGAPESDEGVVAVSASGARVLRSRDAALHLGPDGPKTRPGHTGGVRQLAFLSDGRLVSTAGQSPWMRGDTFVWNTEDCAPEGAPSPSTSIAVAPGTLTWLAFVDRTVTRTDANGTGEAEKMLLPVRSPVLSPDGESWFAGVGTSSDAHARTLIHASVGTTKLLGEIAVPEGVESLALSADGSRLAVAVGRPGGGRGEIRLLSAVDFTVLESARTSDGGQVVFSAMERLLWVPRRNGVEIREVPSLRATAVLHHGECCDVVASSPDGTLVAGALKESLFVWEAATRRLVSRIPEAHRADILSLAFSPDGRHLATGSSDSTALLWDVSKLSVPPSSAKTTVKWRGDAAKAFVEGRAAEPWLQADGSIVPVATEYVRLQGKLAGVTHVAGGDLDFCAIAAKKVRCWGDSSGGILGVPERPGKSQWSSGFIATPTAPPVIDPVDVRIGGSLACALARAGDLVCWGRAARGGPVTRPAPILSGVTSFDLASDRLCVVAKGVARHRIGDGALEDFGSGPHVAVACEEGFTCAITARGEVECAGENRFDRLGDGTGLDRATPVKVPGVTATTALAASSSAVCALSSSGSVRCWGSIGGAHFATATLLPALDGATAIRLRGDAVCGLVRGDALCLEPSG